MTQRISRWWLSVAPDHCTAWNSAARSAAAPCWFRVTRACSARSACWRPAFNQPTRARLLGVEVGRAIAGSAVLVPRYPGLLCALGLLATDLQDDYARTALQRGPDYDLAAIDAVWRGLEPEAGDH